MNSIWDHLGTFIDEYDRLCKAFIEEEANAKKVYKGDESLPIEYKKTGFLKLAAVSLIISIDSFSKDSRISGELRIRKSYCPQLYKSLIGKVRVNLAPLPNSDSTLTWPP